MDMFLLRLEEGVRQIAEAEAILAHHHRIGSDERILASIIGRICKGCRRLMDAMLYLRGYDTDSVVFLTCAGAFAREFPMIDSKFIVEMHEISAMQKSCPLQFIRGGRLVMCGGDLQVASVSKDDAKRYLDKAKLFIEKAAYISEEKEGIPDGD